MNRSTTRSVTLAAGIAASLHVAADAPAGDGQALTVEQIFLDDAGHALPGTVAVFRVYWDADLNGAGPDDQVVGVVGSPGNTLCIEVSGGVFFDGTYPGSAGAAGDRPPSFFALGLPGFEEASYDSWFTVGNTSLDVGPDWPSGFPFEDEIIVAPGTTFDGEGQTDWHGGPGGDPCPRQSAPPDSPATVAWTLPPTQEDPGGGGVIQTPQSIAGNWPGNRIALMQLSVIPDPGGGDIVLEGTGGILTIIDGTASEMGFTLPAPGTLALFGLAALDKRRRRR